MGRIFLWLTSDVESAEIPRERLSLETLAQGGEAISEELRFRGCQVFSLPEDLSLSSGITWINDRAQWGDVALRIAINPNHEYLQVFYTAYNIERKKHAELLLLFLLRQCHSLSSHGTQADTFSTLGKLPFCRSVKIPALEIHLDSLPPLITGWIQGLGDGLMAWSREVAGVESNQDLAYFDSALPYTPITIILNNQPYPDPGLLVNGNPCLPVDLRDRLGIIYPETENFYVSYQGIVYTIAAPLRDYHISLRWDNLSQTLLIISISPFERHHFEQIISPGKASEVQLKLFLKSHHREGFNPFPDLAKWYREEGMAEGVNYDLAFCQMALETNFLRFSPGLTSDMHNFAKLSREDGQEFASFPLARLGVRAHIQHLKAYASLEPLVFERVDPRFERVVRGIAPTVRQLSRRWSADPDYGEKILVLVRQLYEGANFL